MKLTDRNDLFDAGANCVNYLVNCIQSDGSFIYQQNAESGVRSYKYNILRHSGAIFELCLWLKDNHDNYQLELLEQPIKFLLNHLFEWDEHLCIVERGTAKLGGVALALLALSSFYELKKVEALIPIMKRLAGFLEVCQLPDGDFISKIYYDGRSSSEFVSAYYPGQAILALISFYKIDRNERWLNSARKSADFIVSKPLLTGLDRSRNRNFDTWLSKALYQLLSVEYKVSYVKKINDIVELDLDIMNRFFRRNIDANEIFDQSTSASMASLCEALLAGIHWSILSDNREEAVKIFNSLNAARNYCLSLQVTQKVNGTQFIGGIKKNRRDASIRIDFVQHVLSVITSMLQIKKQLN
ncbi:prenyltransferase/squalene oxidase repeat-containing protein [Mucilaginibacter polytrichastri]|uniref:Uncharacterized protein n=1 Tax=Mucilaginibacter polytrichastri TaxID=1302689 RepID=A0A1Q6A2D1_9SPHI|nr:hypothetical protein [Mucilaginibacter polytrichastri]OKS88175.1 hypothetical protein RG47T_3639 [Mucilaginibacter polytrichastri]SFT08866.1 hypothetical protein SAMN04487890_11067 [Mucilaginibacter polytrichastri]